MVGVKVRGKGKGNGLIQLIHHSGAWECNTQRTAQSSQITHLCTLTSERIGVASVAHLTDKLFDSPFLIGGNLRDTPNSTAENKKECYTKTKRLVEQASRKSNW